jgi:hypothetical protein
MKYTTEMASDGMMYAPSSMKICLGIWAILRLLPQQSERLKCRYYLWEVFMIFAVEMTSDGMRHTKSDDDWLRNLSNIKGIT